MRVILAIAAALVLVATSAVAGEGQRRGGNQANAGAIGLGIATGGAAGAATASSSDGDTLSLGIPGAPNVPVQGNQKCLKSNGWGTPILSVNGQEAEPFCMLVWQKDEACGAAKLLANAKVSESVSAEINRRCGELMLAVVNFGKPKPDETTTQAEPKKLAVGPHTQHFQDDAGKVYRIHFQNGVRGGLTPIAQAPENMTFDTKDQLALNPTE